VGAGATAAGVGSGAECLDRPPVIMAMNSRALLVQISMGEEAEGELPSKFIVPSPSRSTSLMICCTSASVGFWPDSFITRANSSTVMFPRWHLAMAVQCRRSCD
jgi:hypothetical protein